MFRMFALCLSLLLFTAAPAGAWFGSGDPDPQAEISPLQYSALLGLRDMDPVLFREKLLPLIDEAMKDGRISNAELAGIEKAAGSVAAQFHKAAKAPSFSESLDEALKKAGEQGKDLGSKMEDVFSNHLPQLFDDAMQLFREQMDQFKDKPQEPSLEGPTAI